MRRETERERKRERERDEEEDNVGEFNFVCGFCRLFEVYDARGELEVKGGKSRYGWRWRIVRGWCVENVGGRGSLWLFELLILDQA